MCLLFIYTNIYAEGESISNGKIKGAVIDAKSNKAVEYASVALYNAVNNEMISGVITDYLGHFKIEKPKEIGEYYLKISFIGLEEIKTKNFKVEEKHSNINLGNFFLKSTYSELEGVEIIAKNSAVEYKIDKKVINVSKQITAEAGTAVDILENAPSVQVDVEGTVSLRGSSSFTVLIDGKPTILEPSDALLQIPSSSIENIEIITNPSVKYDPDGATGIINIITKKNKIEGLSGILNTSVGSYDQYGGNLLLSYRLNKVNFIFGANHRERGRQGSMDNERTSFKNDTTFYIESFGNSERNHSSSSIRSGLEFDVSKNDFISLSGRYGKWDMTTNSDLRYDESYIPASDFFSYNSRENSKRGGNYFSIDGLYQHNFTNKKAQKKQSSLDSLKTKSEVSKTKKDYKASIKHVLNFEINYRNRNSDESSNNQLINLSDELIGGNKNTEDGPSESLRFKLDYTLPVGLLDKFEAGLQGRSGRSNDATELWIYNPTNQQLEINDEYSHSTDYNRNIYAAYSLYAGYLGKFGYQLGLRTEYTNRKINIIGENEFIIDRWDYFPTIHLSYNLPADQQIMSSYSRRIERPRGSWLEPFITWEDQFNVRQGNPALKPEYIDSFDAGYLKKFGDNFLSLEAYYRITNNKVERINTIYQGNVMLRRPENIGKDYSLGLEAMLNIALFKFWDMQLSGNYYNYKLEGEFMSGSGDEIIINTISNSSINWNSQLNNTFQIWKNGVLQINTRYVSSTVTAQGTREGYYTLDAALKLSFLDRQLTANLQARNIMGSAKHETTMQGTGFYNYFKYIPKSPVFALTISYRFNNFKSSSRALKNTEDDTEEL